jgi:hypothetical protein
MKKRNLAFPALTSLFLAMACGGGTWAADGTNGPEVQEEVAPVEVEVLPEEVAAPEEAEEAGEEVLPGNACQPLIGLPLSFDVHADPQAALAGPTAVVVSGDRVYVADYGTLQGAPGVGRVVAYTDTGTFVQAFDAADAALPTFHPYGVASDGEEIWATDLEAGLVVRLTASGTAEGSWGAVEGLGGASKLDQPMGVFEEGGEVFVADSGNHRVVVFSHTGTALRLIGSHGTGDGQLASPSAVFVVADEVYVADTGNKRVQVFTRSGLYSRTLGQAAGLVEPMGVAVAGGAAYVTDRGASLLVRLAVDGSAADTCGGEGKAGGQFNRPRGLSTDGQGFFVSDTGNKRVQKVLF